MACFWQPKNNRKGWLKKRMDLTGSNVPALEKKGEKPARPIKPPVRVCLCILPATEAAQ